MDGSDTEMVYSTELKSYQESLKELVALFERKVNQDGWGDDQHPNAVIATVHATDMGKGETYGSTAFGVRAYGNLPEPWQADFPSTLAVMARGFLEEEVKLGVEGGKEADGDDSPMMQSIDASFLGWAVSFEAFRITPDDEDMEHYAEQRRINEHPNRVEQRMVAFRGIDSVSLVVIRDREQSDDEVTVTVLGENGQVASGTIYQSLQIMNIASLLSIKRRFGADALLRLYSVARGGKGDE